MNPVLVTPELAEARRLCLEHLSRRPKRHEVTELDAWTARAAVLNADLESLIEGKPKQMKTCRKCQEELENTKQFFYGDSTEQDGLRVICKACYHETPCIVRRDSKISEEPMPPLDSSDPIERLAQLSKRLETYTSRKNYSSAYSAKAAIKKHCEKHGLAIPQEAEIGRATPTKTKPKPRETKPKPRETKALVRETSLEPVMQTAIDFGRSIQRHVEKSKPLGDIRLRISGIRAEIWSLCADLERLTPEELGLLAHTLERLDAAAHAALVIEQGRVA